MHRFDVQSQQCPKWIRYMWNILLYLNEWYLSYIDFNITKLWYYLTRTRTFCDRFFWVAAVHFEEEHYEIIYFWHCLWSRPSFIVKLYTKYYLIWYFLHFPSLLFGAHFLAIVDLHYNQTILSNAWPDVGYIQFSERLQEHTMN